MLAKGWGETTVVSVSQAPLFNVPVSPGSHADAVAVAFKENVLAWSPCEYATVKNKQITANVVARNTRAPRFSRSCFGIIRQPYGRRRRAVIPKIGEESSLPKRFRKGAIRSTSEISSPCRVVPVLDNMLRTWVLNSPLR
jgi:hypothetical protein